MTRTHRLSGATRRLLVVLLAGLPPWTVFVYERGVGGFAAYGLVSLVPFHVTWLPTYLAHAVVPGGWFAAWLTGGLLYAFAVGSLLLAQFDLEDRRVTDGLLVLAALNELYFALGFFLARDYLTLPIGGVLLLAVAAWDWRARRTGEPHRVQ